MQTNHGPPQLLCISKLEKPSICSQHWCLSWKRSLQAPWKKKNQKWFHAASSLEKLVKLWDIAGEFLTPAEFATAMALGKEYLLTYKWLHSWSLEKDRKFICHCCKTSHFHPPCDELQVWKPQKTMVFSEGKTMLDTSLRCVTTFSFGVSSTKLTTKWCPKYRLTSPFSFD